MTQLEDYLSQREKYVHIIAQSRQAAKSSAATDEAKKSASKRAAMYAELLQELDEQITALDPSRAKKSKRSGKRAAVKTISLDYEKGDGRGDRSYYRILGKEDDLAFLREPSPEIQKWLGEAASQLTPHQARIVDLRLNKGWTFRKIAEEIGSGRRNTIESFHAAMRIVGFWITVRRCVTKCASRNPFDWDTFLEELDILGHEQKAVLLTLLDSAPEEFSTITEFGAYVRQHPGTEVRCPSAISHTVRTLKRTLLLVGIPPGDIDAIHPLMAYYKPLDYIPDRLIWGLYKIQQANKGLRRRKKR